MGCRAAWHRRSRGSLVSQGPQPARGGSHEGMGTANFLIGRCLSGDHRPGPRSATAGRRAVVGNRPAHRPRIVTWAIRTAGIDGSVAAARALGYDPGQPTTMTRRSEGGEVLQLRLTAPQSNSTMPLDEAAVPGALSATATREGSAAVMAASRPPATGTPSRGNVRYRRNAVRTP
jgi:Glyoxalase-like domain